MALLLGGGYAEFCVTDERTIFHKPQNISFSTATAIPEAFITAYQLLFVGKVQPGESVLIHAAASSIGQAFEMFVFSIKFLFPFHHFLMLNFVNQIPIDLHIIIYCYNLIQ